jgi:UV DNA damage endonuclease
MKIGYPCINRSIDCQGDRTFRLASYTPERLVGVVENNLTCLERMLAYNIEHRLFFVRITSSLVPFASHEVCRFPWQAHFAKRFHAVGEILRQHDFRVSMHPDQFTLLNAQNPEIVRRSVAELNYHADVLELLGLDRSAKIQIHVGGIYGDKPAAVTRFVREHAELPERIAQRLVIENDERLYSLADCLAIHAQTGVPILFDTFHHSILNNGETYPEAFAAVAETWKKKDGVPMVDYSSQDRTGRLGKHAESIDLADFRSVLRQVHRLDFDVMLEIKDKEKSAVAALAVYLSSF